MDFRTFAPSRLRAFAPCCFCAFALFAFCFLPVAAHAQTIPSEIFGEYIGDVHITNELLGIDQTVPEIIVELKNTNSENDYIIKMLGLDLIGIALPVELDKVIITPFEGGYKLSRTESISFTLEGIYLPAIPPLLPEGVYDIPVVISLENSEIIESLLNLNLKVVATITYYLGPIPIPIPVTFYISFQGLLQVPSMPPIITTANLPSGIVNQAYNAMLEATGDTPVTWSIVDGALPSGIILNPLTGSISGIPTEANSFHFTIQAENLWGSSSQPLCINIEEEDTLRISTPVIEAYKIYPNPTTGELRITNCEFEIGTLSEGEVEVFDAYGRKVSFLTSHSSFLNISHLPAGTYFVTIKTKTATKTQVIIKL